MKKCIFAVVFGFLGLFSFSFPCVAVDGPTKMSVVSAQGEKVANEYCKEKYGNDDLQERLCFLAYSGAVVDDAHGGHSLNAWLKKDVLEDPNRPVGTVYSCQLVFDGVTSSGSIKWKKGTNCGYTPIK